jgi:hypothetical protein
LNQSIHLTNGEAGVIDYASGFCQSQSQVNSKPLGPIIISSQSRTGVKLLQVAFANLMM